MRTTDLKDLLEVVAALRQERHPDLDPRFLEAVVRAEEENPEDDEGAIHAIRSALQAVVDAKGGA